jgi:hypothetical protein
LVALVLLLSVSVPGHGQPAESYAEGAADDGDAVMQDKGGMVLEDEIGVQDYPPYFGEQEEGDEVAEEEPEEYEYIETPDMESIGTERSTRWMDVAEHTNMKVFIEDPTDGHVFEGAQVTIRVNAENVPEDEGYSGMLYFGAGNPFPIPMESLPVGITVTDLAPGNYSVKFMLLDPDRQPIGVDADVTFERRAPPGFRPPKPDNSKFDTRIFQISQRFVLAEQADVLEGKNPFADAFRQLAQDNSECKTCDNGELSEADELLAQASPKP